ncbi:MAG: N-acetylmuramic acid 6-phosphate phosphatase MupP [Candidatus Pelagadaptatus aseana]|uniref:HAD-IA family hydrolase n=1 Tax=Candidatus Pelagadaptatus aseana TaxID=3120508 RepID=UPI0039B30CA0
MTVKAVLFDLDGTLLDTAPDFEVVLNQLRQEEGLGPIDADKVRQTVSNGARALVELGFDIKEGEPGFEDLRLRLLALYEQHLAVATKPFPGIEQLLSFCKENNLAWGIATNKPEQYTTPLVRALQLQPDCVICPDHVSERKPHPESMTLGASIIGCQTDEIVYVGDHIRDIQCGNRANCTTIAVRYGYIDEADDINAWQADYIVDQADDISPIIEKLL